MTPKSLAELALKVWGVIMLVGTLTALPADLAMLGTIDGADAQAALFRTSQIVAIAALAFRACVAVGLIVWSDRVVDWIVSDGPSLRIAIRAAEARTLAFAIVGLSVLLDGLENAAVVGYTLYSKPSIESQTMSYLWSRQRDSLVRAVVQLVAGFVLLGGRDYVVGAFARMRSEPLDGYEEHAESTDTHEEPGT
jgi:hypothetical protein